ncbi:MAG: hypothetical protein ACFFDP_05355 [Promethearchaeota archaeon]
MGTKVKVVCPHCGKHKHDVEFKEDGFHEVKGRYWTVLMQQKAESKWMKGPQIGVAADCKCGGVFFIYNIDAGPNNLQVEPRPRANQLVPWFCDDCGQSYLTPDLKCPTCGRAY